MPNKKSAKKRARQNEERNVRNRAARSSLRTAVKKARATLAQGNPAEAKSAALTAFSQLGRAAQKGLIHPNKAARQESRLTKQLNALETAPK